MKVLTTLAFTLLFPFGIMAQVIQGNPEYSNDETKEIIEQLIESHGGWEKWATAPSIRYDNVFYNTSPNAAKNPWWVSTEVIEQHGEKRNEQRVFHEYHLGGNKGSFQMAYDGENVWASENWGIGNYPKFMTYFFYYFLNLPWLTQDDNVILSAPEMATYNELEVAKITMTFKEDPAIGKVNKDSFVLYISQETGKLVAYEYSMGFGAQLDIMGLPKSAETMGPVFRHIDEYVNIDGLLFPSRMHTTNTDQSNTYGHHALLNYSISDRFDSMKVMMPAKAVVDESSSVRAE